MTKYSYSNELKANSPQTDYDMAKLALSGKMEQSIKFITLPVKHYKAKDVILEKKQYQASDGQSIDFYEFTPLKKEESYPAIIYYHGGGFMFPVQKPMMDNSCLYASQCKVKVFLPEYRYVPKVDCTRLMDDCYEMLSYVFEHAKELHVDPDRVLLYGDSAGGCIAACVALRNRDSDHYPLRGQMLLYPVCDDCSANYPSVDQFPYAVWSKKANASMWKLYFHNGVKNLKDFVPMRNACHDLPPAYVEPQEMDVLRDEAIAYASKLRAAGVPVECNLIGGSFHGFDAQLKSPLVKCVFHHRYKVIRAFLA